MIVHDQHYKPSRMRFYKSAGGQTKITTTPTRKELYLGFELELEIPGRKSFKHILSCIDVPWLYAKEDHSLERGFELVSYPITYRFFNRNRNTIKQYLHFFKKKGALAWGPGSAGIHVHLSKSAFTESQLLNFQSLIYSNPEFTKLLSGKTQSSLHCWATIDFESRSELKYKARLKRHPADVDRYVAVNLLNKGTVEVRIFRSTLHPQHFFKDIEFCIAAYDYAGAREKPSLVGFLSWVRTYHRKYPELYKFLRKHYYIRD